MGAGKANADTNLYRPNVELSNKNNFVVSLDKKQNLFFCLVKEKEDAHTDPEFQPMKDDDCTFVEYR